MTEKEFKRKMQLFYKEMKRFNYELFTCPEIERVFGIYTAKDYKKFIELFSCAQFFKEAYRSEGCELRILLLKSFELEVLRTKRYLEY